ncbi:MAG: hypothetical protein HYU63_05585 [Armatimonadetes bacterium]|nr:hypothetical protein [Armatimonadota bacterium]
MIIKLKYILFLSLALFVFSCGGGALSPAGGDKNTSSKNGSLKIAINWPLDNKIGIQQAIPSNTSLIKVDVYDSTTGEKVIPTTSITRDSTQMSVATTITDIPIGRRRIKASAYDSSNNFLGSGIVEVSIVEGDNSQAIVTVIPKTNTYAWLAILRNFNASGSIDQKSMYSGISSTSSLPSGSYYVAYPSRTVFNLDFASNLNKFTITGNYYIGFDSNTSGPAQSVSVSMNKSFSVSSNNIVITFLHSSIYAGEDTRIYSDLAGTYTFNINNTLINLYNNLQSTYPPYPTISSPSHGSSFSRTSYLPVSWNSLGSDYVYFVIAFNPTLINGDEITCDNFWSSVDLRNLSTSNPITFQSLINSLSSTTSANIPASIFNSGNSIRIAVYAINKNRFTINFCLFGAGIELTLQPFNFLYENRETLK